MIPKGRPNLRALDLLSTLRPRLTRSKFEEAVARQAGAQYGVAFTYGHAGFYACLKALELSNAEIIVPAYTCRVIPEVIVATANIPVFVDIDMCDYNMDLKALKPAITSKTKVVVATHMFGNPTNMDAIRETVGNDRVLIVEDAALTFPGSTLGANGLQGDVGLFSFGPGKPLFTLRGGVMVTNDAKLYERLVSYRDKEMNDLPPKEWAKRWVLLALHYILSKNSIYGLMWRLNLSKTTVTSLASRGPTAEDGGHASSLSLPGDYATRYTDLQARMGLTQLRRSASILTRHRALAQVYADTLRGIPGLTPAPIVEGASYSLYTVLVKHRDTIGFGEYMRAQGIETGCTFNYAVPELAEYRPYARGRYPLAERAGREVVNLPIHPKLTERQIHHIVRSARQALRL